MALVSVSIPADAWSAMATTGAALVALGFGVAAERRAQRLQEDADQAQARSVSAWIDVEPGTQVNGPRMFAMVQNNSAEPVWEVVAYAEDARPDDDPTEIAAHREVVGVVPPGPPIRRPLPWTPPDADHAPLWVTFRDNGYRWWERDERGEITRWFGPPPVDVPPWSEAWRAARAKSMKVSRGRLKRRS